MKKFNRFLSILLILAMLVPGLVFADETSTNTSAEKTLLESAMDKFNPELEEERDKLEVDLEEFSKEEDVRIIVELKSDPAIVYATARNMGYSQMSTTSLKNIERNINKEQALVKDSILANNIDMKFFHSFNTAFNGFSGQVKFEDIEAIEKLANVKKVYIANEYERPEIKPDMGTSNDMIGSIPTWNLGYEGEGIVIAIIDTGIDPSHRDMILSEETVPDLSRYDIEGMDLLGKYYTEKIPYGYNYYDLNDEILDLGPEASMHGMHVAGTSGANGDIDNNGVRGVAPESQLLAMKVFSNDPIYATTFSDIYLIAIDEAVKLGADVLNMSLGSTASFYIPDSAEDVAITNATNNGIVCSVSAGNSGSLTYGWSGTNYGYPRKENPDIGVVGAPGLNKDTIQVASIENTHQKVNSLSYVLDGVEHNAAMAIAGNIDPAEELPGIQEYVDCGSGHPSELTNVAGKIALVVRGGLTPNFVDKIQNAQDAGASAVIVRNHESGGEELVNMATPAGLSIPAAFIGYTDGLALAELDEKVLTFSDELMTIPNPNANLLSDFTSWGVTPSLELKPEITAPGGQIYSTLNDDKYGMMSGTSMAAPHVSGGSGLVMEYIKEHSVYGDLSLAEQARLAKVLLMNTADIVYDEYECEYSPRRQGAGLMNLYGAVSTPVRLVNRDTNEAKVELKDFEDTSFTMRFKAINDSDTDVTYDVETIVLTDYIFEGTNLNSLSTDYIYDAEISQPETITVAANDEYEFEVTIDIGTDSTIYRNMFVEGFVKLTDLADENPPLSIPYVGFYGDWGEPNILDGMRYIDPAGESYFTYAGMLGAASDGYAYYYSTPTLYMNPGTLSGYINGSSNVIPYLSFMRNAENVDYNILDKDGSRLRAICIEEYARKNYVNGGSNSPVRMVMDAMWDGTIDGQYVDEGNYFYEINATIHYDGAEEQTKTIPITVDYTAPSINDLAYNPETGVLTWNSIDEGAGIQGFMFSVNGVQLEEVVHGEVDKTDYEFNISEYVNKGGSYEISVISVDNILNMNLETINYINDSSNPYIYITNPILLDVLDANEVEVEGYVANFANVDRVLVNGIEADIEYIEDVDILHPEDPDTIIYSGPAYRFNKTINLQDGYQEITVEAISGANATGSLVRRIYVDTTNPELSIVVNEIDDKARKASLEITMYDNLGSLYLYEGDSQIYVYEEPLVIPDPSTKLIDHTVNLKEGENTFVFTLYDVAGHEIAKQVDINLEIGGDPAISNIKPSEVVEFRAGDTLTVSFNAPRDGDGYFRLMLPFDVTNNSYGVHMTEVSPGFYRGTWTIPTGLQATDLQLEVIYEGENGLKLFEIADGSVTIVGDMEDLAVNSMIIGDEAYDSSYIDDNPSLQRKMINWINAGNKVYIKITDKVLVDLDGNRVNMKDLPERVTYFDKDGNELYFEK